MPRNVRNFWITLDVDGSKKQIASGPRSANGGFDLTLLLREHGEISDKKLYIIGRANDDTIQITVYDETGTDLINKTLSR